jgi:hypothetical protein
MTLFSFVNKLFYEKLSFKELLRMKDGKRNSGKRCAGRISGRIVAWAGIDSIL